MVSRVEQERILEEAKKYIKETSVSGLYVVTRSAKLDDRGGFRMVSLAREFEVVLRQKFEFAQWNHSWSEPGVIRGIHPDPWDKLVYPITGKVFLAIADIRPDSSTFGRVETFNFDSTSKPNEFFALFISRGLGNSLCNYGEELAHYLYLVNDYWDGTQGSGERGVPWNDPDLNIPWPIKNPILSEADRKHQPLREQFPDKFR
jgi:dTDP-4-dehydrorhamnose 3,5-epimerase